jgi:hypothetical protein
MLEALPRLAEISAIALVPVAPDEVPAAVLWLTSSTASFVSGSNITVSGGR